VVQVNRHFHSTAVNHNRIRFEPVPASLNDAFLLLKIYPSCNCKCATREHSVRPALEPQQQTDHPPPHTHTHVRHGNSLNTQYCWLAGWTGPPCTCRFFKGRRCSLSTKGSPLMYTTGSSRMLNHNRSCARQQEGDKPISQLCRDARQAKHCNPWPL
jgi:hypothetical protein